MTDTLTKSQPISTRTSAALRWILTRLGNARNLALRSVVVLAVLALWWLSSHFGWIRLEVLPSPGQVLAALVDLFTSGDMSRALPVSLHRAFTGFAIGSGIGLLCGLIAGLLKVGEQIVDAPLQIFRSIPFIALLPLFVTWFGIGEQSKIMLIIFATIFPVYLNTYGGARNVDSKLVEAAQAFELTKRQIALRVILPVSLPSVITGLRYSSSTALLALVVSEQINASSGIGFILMTANQQQNSAIVVAVVVIYAVLGILLDLFWRLVERLLLPWRSNVEI